MNPFSDMWNEICFLLSENIKPHFTEKDFENQVVRALEVLGWREFRKEIERQPTIQLGREGSLRPDIVVYDQDKRALIVLEVKRPSEDITKDNPVGQLRSYMRQMKSDFGFLVGADLRVYYDGTLNPQPDPLLIDKFSFIPNSNEGINFASNFNKDNFLKNKYSQHVENKIKKFNKKREVNKLLELMLSEDINRRIIGFLRKEFADYGDETFSEAMKKLSIEISKREVSVPPEHHKGPDRDIPKPTRLPKRKIVRPIDQKTPVTVHVDSQKFPKIAILPFESNLEVRLRHIYGILYFMKQGYDFPSATHQTLELFPEVQDYQTISDKCARGFAGSVDTFIMWYNSGEILNKLTQKFNLSDHDYNIFKNLLSS